MLRIIAGMLLVAVMCLAGCAGTKSKYVEGQTIYSTTLPRVELSVAEAYSLAKDEIHYGRAANDERNSKGNSVIDTVFEFSHSAGTSYLVVDFRNMSDTHWYFESLSCDGAGNLTSESSCTLAEKCCARVIVAGEDRSLLKKEYSLDYGRKAKLFISYFENLAMDLDGSAPLDDRQRDYVNAFEQRADASFQLIER